MTDSFYEMQWPRDNLFLTCYAHEIMNYRYHWHQNEFELDILLHGKQDFCCGTETFQMEEDDVILVNPGTGHASLTRQENTCALVLRFSQAAFRPFLKRGFRYSFPNILSTTATRDDARYRRLRFYAAQILHMASQSGPYASLAVKASMELLLVTLGTLFEPRTEKILLTQDEQHQETIHQIITYLERHYQEKITLQDVADFTQYNRTYLSTLFKNTVGINFYEYLMRVRFQNALVELATTSKNLTEIAIGNGFSDLKSFNARFRDTLHYMPSEYRARLATTPGEVEGARRSYIPPTTDRVAGKLMEYLRLPEETSFPL